MLGVLEQYDYIKDTVIDPMYHLYLHVVKETLDLWFDKAYQVFFNNPIYTYLSNIVQDKNFYPWSLYDKIELIDQNLKAVNIPHGREEPL